MLKLSVHHCVVLALVLLSLSAHADSCGGRTAWQAVERTGPSTCLAALKTALARGPNLAEFSAAAYCVVNQPARRTELLAEIAKSNGCVAETLMQFDASLAAADDAQALMQRAYTHYVINTPGPLGGDDQFDSVARAAEYARQLLQVEPDRAVLEGWRFASGLCMGPRPACELRSIGQMINMARYGRSDVIPSTLFSFNVDTDGHDPQNAQWLADMAELAYHPWACKSEDASGEPLRKDDPKAWTCVQDQLAAWGYEGHEISADGTEAFIAIADDKIVIAFRGTQGLFDIATDLKTWLEPERGGGKVHKGFATALDAVWPKLSLQVTRLPEDRPIFVTGHSLGGALAQLAAYRIERDGRRNVHAVYTYGSPRLGNKRFATRYSRRLGNRTFLHINGLDPVARVPTKPFFQQNKAYVGRFDRDNHRFDASPVPEEPYTQGLLETAKQAIEDATTYLFRRPEEEIPLSYGSVNSFDTSIGGYHRASQYLFKLACLNTERRYEQASVLPH